MSRTLVARHAGKGTDHRHRLRSLERQHALVFKEHRALRGGLPGKVGMGSIQLLVGQRTRGNGTASFIKPT